jgi:hypothetical protein
MASVRPLLVKDRLVKKLAVVKTKTTSMITENTFILIGIIATSPYTLNATPQSCFCIFSRQKFADVGRQKSV